MTCLSALRRAYVLLSVGDGLVAQIPSLLLAISTAIIVTRVSATHDWQRISASGQPVPRLDTGCRRADADWLRAWHANSMFLVAALVAAGAGYWSWMRERGGSDDPRERTQRKPPHHQIELSEIADNTPISVSSAMG